MLELLESPAPSVATELQRARNRIWEDACCDGQFNAFSLVGHVLNWESIRHLAYAGFQSNPERAINEIREQGQELVADVLQAHLKELA